MKRVFSCISDQGDANQCQEGRSFSTHFIGKSKKSDTGPNKMA